MENRRCAGAERQPMGRETAPRRAHGPSLGCGVGARAPVAPSPAPPAGAGAAGGGSLEPSMGIYFRSHHNPLQAYANTTCDFADSVGRAPDRSSRVQTTPQFGLMFAERLPLASHRGAHLVRLRPNSSRGTRMLGW